MCCFQRDDWREYKFDMLNEENLLTGDKKVKLEFKTNGKYITDITNCGWNINNIRRCSKNGRELIFIFSY